MTIKTNRRNILKFGTGLAAIGLTAVAGSAVAGLVPETQEKLCQLDSSKIKWEEEFDIIVVGSGVAATVASTFSAKKGAKVCVLEKMSVLGGSSAISNATIAVAGSDLQKKLGIEDNWESFYNDMQKRSAGYNRSKCHEVIAKRAKDVLAFMIGEGCIFEGDLSAIGGQSVKRVLSPKTNGAIGIMNPLRKKFHESYGGKSYTRHKVIDIIYNDKGRVIGVAALKNYRFDTTLYSDDLENKTGHLVYYKAKKAVICGTGGFCNDKILRDREFPKYKNLVSSQSPGATMSGPMLFEKAGGELVNMSHVQHSLPLGATLTSIAYVIDPATSKRFFNELGDDGFGLGKGGGSARYNVNVPDTVAKFIDKNGGIYPICIFDEKTRATYEDPLQFERNIGAGFVVKGDSIEDLARKIRLDPALLKATNDRYNSMVEKGVDEDFHKDLKAVNAQKIDKAPFYAYYVFPHLNYCCGGVYINENGSVIRKYSKDEPIIGLYAAGEATGSVHGAGRISGTSIADGSTFGMVSAEHALTLSDNA